MVCLGNICRSPVAQGCMEAELVKRFGPDHGWTVDSAGTSEFHRGEHPDVRSQASARRHGIDISSQCSRPLEMADFERFDHILVMDQSNMRNVKEMNASGPAEVVLVLDASFAGESREVPDPYYGGEQGFEWVVQLLQQACRDWLDRWAYEERSI